MKCPTGKRLYLTEQLAEAALIEAHIHYEYRSGQGPIAVYQCDDCGNFHLTSRGPMNERLSQLITNGSIKKQRDASRWQDKFRGRG